MSKNSPRSRPQVFPGFQELTQLFKSVADEHRLHILYLLSQQGELNVSAIGEALGQSQPAVSHHLGQLKNAGLIAFRRDGKFNYYKLSENGLHQVFQMIFPQVDETQLDLAGIVFHFKKQGTQ